MALTPPPAAPQRGDRTTFASRVDAFITWLINFVTELVALVGNLNSLAAGGAYSIQYTIGPFGQIGLPSGGLLALSSGTQNASTTVYLDTKSFAGADMAAVLDRFDASTSTVKGQIRIQKIGDPTAWLTFDVTARTSAGSYRSIAVANTGGSSASPFVAGDAVMLYFQRTGDKGDSGALTSVLWVRDEKASGMHGGASTASQTVQRTLNTIKKNSIGGAGLSGNQITLPAGVYRTNMRAPSNAGYSQAWIFNVTDNSILLLGSSVQNADSQVAGCEFTLNGTKVLEVRHYTYASNSVGGLGQPSGSGQTEVYTELFIEKVS